MLLRYCLIYMTIIIPRQILYLVYLCPCVGLGLFMLYLYVLFFIFSLIFIIMNHITSLKHSHLFFVHFLEYLLLFLDDHVDEKKLIIFKQQKFSIRVLLSFCLIFCQFQPGIVYKNVQFHKSIFSNHEKCIVLWVGKIWWALCFHLHSPNIRIGKFFCKSSYFIDSR